MRPRVGISLDYQWCDSGLKWQGSDYEDDGVNILLDANENANGPALLLDHGHHLQLSKGTVHSQPSPESANLDLSRLNRYPDP